MCQLRQTIEKIRPLDQNAMAKARLRLDSLTKPRGSLGRLEELGIRLAGITGKSIPQIHDKVIIVMAGDHGVAAEGVSAYPQEVTAQMELNLVHGGAGVSVLARHVGARVVCVDIGVAMDVSDPGVCRRKVGYGTGNIAAGPAMSREEAIKCLETGIQAAEEQIAAGADLLGTGDLGIGNTTPSTAILAALSGMDPDIITGRGTGLSDQALAHKKDVLKQCLAVNRPDPQDGLDVLAKVGGLEIGGIAGVILGAAAHRVPVVVDGLISGAGALIAAQLASLSTDYMIHAHRSEEPGHAYMLKRLQADPLLDLRMRLGEGTGAALAMGLVDAAAKIMCEMTTFTEAEVSDRDDA